MTQTDHLILIRKVASKYRSYEDFDDLVAIGWLASYSEPVEHRIVLKCIWAFKEHLRQQAKDVQRKTDEIARQSSLQSDPRHSQDNTLLLDDLMQRSYLSFLEKETLYNLFYREKTLGQVALDQKVTVHSVQQTKKKAIQKLQVASTTLQSIRLPPQEGDSNDYEKVQNLQTTT